MGVWSRIKKFLSGKDDTRLLPEGGDEKKVKNDSIDISEENINEVINDYNEDINATRERISKDLKYADLFEEKTNKLLNGEGMRRAAALAKRETAEIEKKSNKKEQTKEEIAAMLGIYVEPEKIQNQDSDNNMNKPDNSETSERNSFVTGLREQARNSLTPEQITKKFIQEELGIRKDLLKYPIVMDSLMEYMNKYYGGRKISAPTIDDFKKYKEDIEITDFCGLAGSEFSLKFQNDLHSEPYADVSHESYNLSINDEFIRIHFVTTKLDGQIRYNLYNY